MVNEQKMSKTTGNVVSPQTCIDIATATGLRYFLLHEGVPASDGSEPYIVLFLINISINSVFIVKTNCKDFSMTRLVRIANSDLADGLGNLVNRCCGKSLNPLQTRLAVSPSSFEVCGSPGLELLDLLRRTPDIVYEEYLQWNFYK